jgi:hypothetical protein
LLCRRGVVQLPTTDGGRNSGAATHSVVCGCSRASAVPGRRRACARNACACADGMLLGPCRRVHGSGELWDALAPSCCSGCCWCGGDDGGMRPKGFKRGELTRPTLAFTVARSAEVGVVHSRCAAGDIGLGGGGVWLCHPGSTSRLQACRPDHARCAAVRCNRVAHCCERRMDTCNRLFRTRASARGLT